MNAPYVNKLGLRHQMLRLLWSIVWAVFARWIPRSLGLGWKRFLLRLFGADIADTAVVYSSASIYYPPHLHMAAYSCLASNVECYCVAPVYLGEFVTVSQYAYLCTASHDINSPTNELITKPITIEKQAWIGAGAFIGMGVKIGEGAVVGARAAVFKDIGAWDVVGGNPAKFIKKREIQNQS